jgi:hypothetical protein
VEVFPAGTALPAELKLTAAVAPASPKGFLKLLTGSEGSAAPTPVAELVFETKDKTEVSSALTYYTVYNRTLKCMYVCMHVYR